MILLSFFLLLLLFDFSTCSSGVVVVSLRYSTYTYILLLLLLYDASSAPASLTTTTTTNRLERWTERTSLIFLHIALFAKYDQQSNSLAAAPAAHCPRQPSPSVLLHNALLGATSLWFHNIAFFLSSLSYYSGECSLLLVVMMTLIVILWILDKIQNPQHHNYRHLHFFSL